MKKTKTYSYVSYTSNNNPCIIMECTEIDITNGDPTLDEEVVETETTEEDEQ